MLAGWLAIGVAVGLIRAGGIRIGVGPKGLEGSWSYGGVADYQSARRQNAILRYGVRVVADCSRAQEVKKRTAVG